MGSDGASRLCVVATGNAHKVEEIAEGLHMPEWRFVAAGEMESGWESPVEDGETFEDNARIKALAAYRAFGTAALADDSGLEVDALAGEPGVHSRYFAGAHATDAQNNALLLDTLNGVAPDQRTARFRSVIVFIDEQGRETVASGTCEGRIALEPRGDQGFGYDPLFLPDATPGVAMAELSMTLKNRISHRGAALAEFSGLIAP